MARGVSPGPPPLPKPSFVKVDEDSTQPTGVHDQQARSYGYNDFSDFKRPEHYIRHIEPLESELAVQVEYDMDEQDQEWLDAVNADRKKEQLDKVSYEVFEVIMDRLEKEWFDLTKNIPKPDMALPSEDSTCAICDDSEGENSNAIVFCDGCNLAVHQDCYGVPYIPEGQWLCRKCTVSPENPVSCILCPNEGGAFKQTIHGEWVHLLCAIWVPETRVVNDVFMEPITGVDKIPKQRWKLRCSICDVREGACIQCNKATCFLAFHPTCARKEKLLMPMKSTQGTEPATLQAFCEKHLPREQYEARKAALAAERETPEAGDERRADAKAAKSARAYAKTYKLGPPLVPAVIVDRIMQYISKVNIRKKQDFLYLVCKYWSLKREARRGAPLLKRLHLEPWTASAGGKAQTDEEKAMKLEYMKRLRQDLDIVRVLAEMCRKRESRKLQQAEVINDLISHCLYPHEAPLRLAFERIMGFDRLDFFKNPVSRNDVPDYFDIIERPMCWSIIDDKLDKHEYWNLQDLKDDINLVLNNAMVYNKPDTRFHKAAARIKANAEPILEELDRQAVVHHSDSIDARAQVGDLEPPLSILDLLFSVDHIKDDTNLLLEAPPLISLLNYELEKLKPPPPPPPTPPPKPKKGKKRARKELGADTIDASPGFRAPRTRRALAAAAAFEAEARGETESTDKQPEETPVPEPEAAPAAKEKQVKPKKSVPRLPRATHTEMPPVVDDVDSRESFKKFEQGWILPPDVRRGGRAPVARSPLPPPKKKKRLSASKSRLSAAATSSTENETLHLPSSVHSEETSSSVPAPPPEGDTTAMQVDVPESAGGPSEAIPEAAGPPIHDDIPLDASSPLTVEPEEQNEDVLGQHDSGSDSAMNDSALSNPRVDSQGAKGAPETAPGVEQIPDAEPAEANVEESEEAAHPAAAASTEPAADSRSADAVPEGAEKDRDLHPEAEVSTKSAGEEPSGMTVPAPETTNKQEPTEERLDEKPKKSAPQKRIVIDVLDTPATRREKAMRKRLEKMQREEAARAGQTSTPGPSTAPPDAKAKLEDDDEDSALSDLSDLGSDDEGAPNAHTQAEEEIRTEEEGKAEEARKEAEKAEAGAIVLDDDDYLEGGTLDSFPWWAAVVFEPDDPGIPKAVLREKEKVKRTMSGPLHLVRFYDSKSSWYATMRPRGPTNWLELDKLRYLGEDKSLDEEFLQGSSRQRFKTKGLRNECRAAYRRAIAEMEQGDEDQATETDGKSQTATVDALTPDHAGEPDIAMAEP
ncbi:hypothetical protein GLOTRDRAFT_105199 [Gloeophyllum trabeum ATCC 11539]|uniref:Bromodomain-containing protein n=1 Tax=Gloeophyllum trabeum (strain ATCC 11539 / FP-39264 / Madison 617) TaxID=670483 RepID=S7Q9N2_GLOTA|nr:uncharacterized protein GLOTRDRAFT_105199 [Gloeophyllum trabeum ATCC 11539]EPQ56227.1 hypothetical protein GLOTRDRAFT_105199 [Gloeophyllum trabeum ATCC 11539]